jgi:hypothetical protein
VLVIFMVMVVDFYSFFVLDVFMVMMVDIDN